jgi:hypothetical protein
LLFPFVPLVVLAGPDGLARVRASGAKKRTKHQIEMGFFFRACN